MRGKGNGSGVDAKSADLNPMCEDYRPGQIYLAQVQMIFSFIYCASRV
jgi:hypothetical protein